MSYNKIFDMVVIGAGLSGVGAACRYKIKFPNDNILIFESRASIGGTWDLFKYPGIRSDSDMLTLGYDFRPWTGNKTLADGKSIRDYIHSVAKEYDIMQFIKYMSEVTSVNFSTKECLWHITLKNLKTGLNEFVKTKFIVSSTGYYRYDKGHTPAFSGQSKFLGKFIHPQNWPEDLDYKNKNMIVIGSGATAFTLVPELSKKAKHVTMLQRSPSYVASIPSVDRIGIIVRSIMPKNLAFKVNRFKNIFLARYLYLKARNNPEKSRNWFRKKVIKELGTNYPVDLHFNPKYNPWDQRVCMVPDGDIFSAIRNGKASIVTDEIDQFDESGISLKSGEYLDADIIVSATGLEVLINGGCEIYIDGKKQELADCFGYKGTMYSGIPNYFSIFGYTNASWTLRVNLISEFVLRVIEYVKINEYKKVVPVMKVRMQKYPWINFQAGYFLRVMDKLPNQGDRHPWLNLQDYKIDKKLLTQDPIDDGDLIFSD